MGNIGAGELILIFLVALLVFGAKRLPEIARGLGQGMQEFKRATREITTEIHNYDPKIHDTRSLSKVEKTDSENPVT